MISIQQIEYIIALSEELHFQKASERCFVTQPTLSMQVKKAEEILGHDIFNRYSTPISLTHFGEKVIPILRNVIEEYGRIETLSAKTSGTYVQEIRMGVIPTIASYMITDLYRTWKKKLEHVQLTIEELTTEELLSKMELGKIDVGILAGPVSNPKWRINKMYDEEILAYFPESDKEEVNTEDLMDAHPWLLTTGNCLRTQMMNFCELRTDDKTEWDYQGGNMDILIDMVNENGGYTLIPMNHIRKKTKGYKRIRSRENLIPAREVIAISRLKNEHWESIQKIVHEVQLKYSGSQGDFQILSWK
jgi:LysR family hydrogen peroxide-inducible transcriptional activator